MPDTQTPIDTQPFLDALEAALAKSNAPEQRQKRERLAAISREAEALSADITAADEAVTNAEKALHAHLAAKHGATAPISQTPATDDPEPSARVRARPTGDHASNCAVYFEEPCDCQ